MNAIGTQLRDPINSRLTRWRMHVCTVCMVIKYSKSMHRCQSCTWSAEHRKMNISLSAFAPKYLVSRDGFGSPVPRQPAHHNPLDQSRVYRVTQLRTDGVHCRESAGTGPVNLKVVPNEGCLGRSLWTNQFEPLFPTPTIYWYDVGMMKVPATGGLNK